MQRYRGAQACVTRCKHCKLMQHTQLFIRLFLFSLAALSHMQPSAANTQHHSTPQQATHTQACCATKAFCTGSTRAQQLQHCAPTCSPTATAALSHTACHPPQRYRQHIIVTYCYIVWTLAFYCSIQPHRIVSCAVTLYQLCSTFASSTLIATHNSSPMPAS